MKEITTKYFIDRKEWRKWLETNFETKDDIWLEYPLKKTCKKRILYNDAVEEALCFGWIDLLSRMLPDRNLCWIIHPKDQVSIVSGNIFVFMYIRKNSVLPENAA